MGGGGSVVVGAVVVVVLVVVEVVDEELGSGEEEDVEVELVEEADELPASLLDVEVVDELASLLEVEGVDELAAVLDVEVVASLVDGSEVCALDGEAVELVVGAIVVVVELGVEATVVVDGVVVVVVVVVVLGDQVFHVGPGFLVVVPSSLGTLTV